MQFFTSVKMSSKLKELKFLNEPRVSLLTTNLTNPSASNSNINGKKEEKDSLISGIASAIIDTSMEEAAAYEYLKMSREGVRAHREKGGIEKFVRRINDHSQYYVQSRDLGIPGLGPREWRTLMIRKNEGDDKMIITYEDTKDLDEDIPTSNVVGKAKTTWYANTHTHTHTHTHTRNVV